MLNKYLEWAWYAMHAIPMYDSDYEYEMDYDTYQEILADLTPVINYTKKPTLYGIPISINDSIKGIRLVSVVTTYHE